DAAATSAIACFLPGTRSRSIRLRRVANVAGLGDLAGGTRVPAATLRAANRWGPLVDRPGAPCPPRPAGQVELGELCRVHRGQATGSNKVWITGLGGAGGAALPPCVLFPTVTRASELFAAGDVLTSTAGLRSVIDLPADLDELSEAELA